MGSWTQGQVDRLEHDVRSYFRVYYSELRRLLTAHEDADFPYWLRGGREIGTRFCTDGVVITHAPYDVETHTFPEREDSLAFYTGEAAEGLSAVDVVRLCSPKFPDGSRMDVLPADWPGGDFGYYLSRWPAYDGGHPAGEGRYLGIITQWTRLDVASLSYLHVWRDTGRARTDAWETVRPYVEEDDDEKLPVPRPL